LVTLYFDEPDAVSHDHGPVSRETGEVVERLDSLIGVLRVKLKKLPYYKRINLIVLSDHGMSQLSPEKYINLRQLVPERMIDGIYGSNPVYLINPASGKKDSVLLLLNSGEGVRAYKKEEVPARLNYGTHPRIPELVAIGDSSWSLGTRPDASSYTGGAHGYDNSNTDMHAIFYASGPAFKKGHTIDQMNNTDIYNIICSIMKIRPAPNDGNPDVLKQVLKR
jgi:alkaline phosphatase D